MNDAITGLLFVGGIASLALSTVYVIIWNVAEHDHVFRDVKCTHGYMGIHLNEPCYQDALAEWKRNRRKIKTNGDVVLFLVRTIHPLSWILKWWLRPINEEPVMVLASPQPNENLWKLPR